MEVLATKRIGNETAAKVLKKFVNARQSEEENAELMMSEEVKNQLQQLLDHLEGKTPVVKEEDTTTAEEEEAEAVATMEEPVESSSSDEDSE
ncbi:TPA: hypothetical protein N0F65_001297 [Lagenidium giganteum]|uniref:Uncharacterized protein n=1 Tax=Lagenidium giganteum TaxID=4803 RepID=A0AAV2Z302_9STRA|nr:TPA: hypothetical protein N0F65_001297 [Lagenidium giganteum]